MKAMKILWICALPALLLGGLYTGRRELFLLFFMLAAVPLYGFLLNVWNLFSFSFVQELSENQVVKGATPSLNIQIHNEKWFPLTTMHMGVQTVMVSEKSVLRFDLPPQSSIVFRVPIHSGYRGVYPVGMTTMAFHDIFGLVHSRFDMRSLPYYRQRTLKIYPRQVILPFLPARTPDAKQESLRAFRRAEEGDSFAEVRQFQPGDSLKRLHRVASARRRELLIKTYDVPMETAVLVAVDTGLLSDGTEEDSLWLADLACECAGAIVRYSLQAGFAVHMLDNDFHRPVIEGRGLQDFPPFYEALATKPFVDKEPLAPRLEQEIRRLPHLRTVYVVTARPAADLLPLLAQLTREGCGVKVLALSRFREALGENPVGMYGIDWVPVAVGDELESILS